MFWRFAIGLFAISIIFPFVYALLSLPLNGVAALLFAVVDSPEGQTKRASSCLSYPLMGLIILANVYILSGWSAYVAARALLYSSAPEVTHKWFYFLVGFILCHSPLGFMASKEAREGSSSSCLYIAVAMLAYILFSFWPRLMALPYGWVLKSLFS